MIDGLLNVTLLNPTFQIWMEVFFTMMMLSFLYRDNPLYKLGENIFLGISIGWGWVMSWEITVMPFLIKPIGDMFVEFHWWDLQLFVWLALGSTLLFRFTRNKAWVSNYYFAFLFAYVAGVSIPNGVQNILIQVGNLMQPLNQGSFYESSKWFVIIFGSAAALSYFFFSKPHKGALGKAARTGILLMMVCFGAAFGTTIMGRVALFIGRAQVLVGNPVQSIVSTIVIAIILFIYFKFFHKEEAFNDDDLN